MENNTKEIQIPENLENVFLVGDRESTLTVSREQVNYPPLRFLRKS